MELKIENIKKENEELKKELAKYKKGFEILYGAVDIVKPANYPYECLFTYDWFPYSDNQKEVALVKELGEILIKEIEISELKERARRDKK